MEEILKALIPVIKRQIQLFVLILFLSLPSILGPVLSSLPSCLPSWIICIRFQCLRAHSVFGSIGFILFLTNISAATC